jgi:hypothetical protein
MAVVITVRVVVFGTDSVECDATGLEIVCFDAFQPECNRGLILGWEWFSVTSHSRSKSRIFLYLGDCIPNEYGSRSTPRFRGAWLGKGSEVVAHAC